MERLPAKFAWVLDTLDEILHLWILLQDKKDKVKPLISLSIG